MIDDDKNLRVLAARDGGLPQATEKTKERKGSLSERSTEMQESKQPRPGPSVPTAPGRTPHPTTQATPPATLTDHRGRVHMAVITGARQHLDLSAAARALKDLPRRHLDAQVAETKAQTRRLLVENHQLMNPKSPISLDAKE